MALTAASAQCRFIYTCAAGATDQVKRQALAQGPGGDIRVASDHDVVTAVGHLLGAPRAGIVAITMHLVEFLILPGITFELQLDAHSPDWSVQLQWLSALWQAMLNAGMETGRLETIELYRARVQDGIALVTAAERTMALPNVIVNPVHKTLGGHISRPAA